MKTRLLTIFGCCALFAVMASAQSNVSYTINLPGGGNGNYYLIANQLDHGSNTLDEVLPNVPDGTIILTWDCAVQDFSSVTPTYEGFSHHWTPNSILTPGQGAFLVPGGPLASITFTGTPHVPVLPVALDCGYGSATILSRQTNGIGTFENITGSTPTEGSRVELWNVGVQDYSVYTFSCGVWAPSVPSVGIGEAARITVADPSAGEPNIYADISDRTICNLTTVSFSVTVCGNAPLSYQWQKNLVDLADGATIAGSHTATLTILNADAPDAGAYQVVVTNAAGTTSSSTANLAITDCGAVLYERLVHRPLGQASLALDVPSNQLTIGNIGSSGQDGVDIALPLGNDFAGQWLDLDPNDALPAGAYVQSQMIGTAGSVSNGVLGTTRCTKAGTSNYVISVDYSPLGSSNYTVQIYNGSDLVTQLTGQTGAACATVKLPPGSCTINPWLNNEWPSPTLITISGGPAVVGTEIVMIPESAATVSAITTERILASNVSSITMTNETLSVTYAGLRHRSLGDDVIIINLLDRGSNTLSVANLGSSGQDGVSIALPSNLSGLDVHWEPLDRSNSLPIGAYVQEQIIGMANSQPKAMLGTVTMTKTGNTNFVISADFSPAGASTYTVRAYRNGIMVAQATNQPGTSLATCNIWGDSGCIPQFPPILGGGWDWTNTPVDIGSGPVLCDHLYITPENVSGTATDFQIVASQVPAINITRENATLIYQGLANTSLGNAYFIDIVPDEPLVISNLGSSGQDGVDIAFNGNNFAGSWLDLDPSNSLPIGAYVQSQMIGTAGTVTNGILGTTRCTKAGTSNYVITVNYSPLGSSSHTIQVYNGSLLVAQVTGQTASVCATVKLPPGSCTINPDLNNEWKKPTLISINGGPSVMGTGIVMIPEGGATISSITAERILAANIPSITITNEDVSVIYAGLKHISLGNAFITVVSNGTGGALVISNLGSSGQDGVDIALAPLVGGVQAFWEPLDPTNGLSVGAYIQSQMFGTGGAVTNDLLGWWRVTKMGISNYVVTADYSPLGSSTMTVQVYNGTNLVASRTGQSGPLGTIAGCVDDDEDGNPVPRGPFGLPLGPFGGGLTMFGPLDITLPGGMIVTGDRFVILPEGAATVTSLSHVQLLASGIPQIVITNMQDQPDFGRMHNGALAYYFSHNPLGTNLTRLTRADVNTILDTLSNYLASAGMDTSIFPLATNQLLQIYERQGMFYTDNGVDYYARPVPLDSYLPVIVADMAAHDSMSLQMQAAINLVNTLIVTGAPPAAILTMVSNTFLAQSWPVAEQGRAKMFGEVFLSSYEYWGGAPTGGTTPAAIGFWGEVGADVAGAFAGSEASAGVAAGLAATGIGAPAAGVVWATCTCLGGALASAAAGSALTVSHATMTDYGNVPHTGLSGTLDVAFGNLVCAPFTNGVPFGVSRPTIADQALDVHWQALEQSNTLPIGAYVQEQIIGTANGITNGLLGTVTMTKMGTSSYVVSADFSPIGATHFTVQAYRDGVLVAQATGQNGASLASCNIWGDSGCIPQPPIFGGGWDWTNELVTIAGGASAFCDHLYVIPENVSGTSTALQLMASQIPALTITEEDSTLVYGGLILSALGNAFLTIVSNGPPAIISNLGTQGIDGVSIALPGNAPGLDVHWQTLDPSSAVGAYIQERLVGTANGVTNGILGTVTMTKAGNSNYVISADFSPIGVNDVIIEAFQNGLLVAQRTNQTSAPLASANIWGDSGCTPLPPIIGGGWDWTNILMNIVGGPSVMCDHLYIMPQNVSGTPTTLQITASQVPSLNLTAVTASPLIMRAIPTPAGLTLQWFGTGRPQQSSDLKTWTDISNAVSPLVVPLGLTGQFYRIATQ